MIGDRRASWPDGFMADDDSSGRRQVLDHAQAQRKSEIQPDRMGDDIGWKPMATIEGIPNLAHGAKVIRKIRTAHQCDSAFEPLMCMVRVSHSAPWPLRLCRFVGLGDPALQLGREGLGAILIKPVESVSQERNCVLQRRPLVRATL
jgi:hypothetical protein